MSSFIKILSIKKSPTDTQEHFVTVCRTATGDCFYFIQCKQFVFCLLLFLSQYLLIISGYYGTHVTKKRLKMEMGLCSQWMFDDYDCTCVLRLFHFLWLLKLCVSKEILDETLSTCPSFLILSCLINHTKSAGKSRSKLEVTCKTWFVQNLCLHS